MMADEEKKDRQEAGGTKPAPGNGEPAAQPGLSEPGAPKVPTPEAIARLGAENAELRAKLEEALVSAKRWQAEFVNYQARVARDREVDRRFAHEGLLRELLPGLDTLQHAVAELSKSGPPAAAEAVRLVEREVLRILARQGVQPIEAQGQPFDPSLHDAFGVVETSDHADGAVAEVLRPGYTLHGRVLRPAQVRVARRAEKPAGP